MGHRLALSLAGATIVAELVLDGAAKTVDISTLRMTRFAEGDLNTTTYSFRVIA